MATVDSIERAALKLSPKERGKLAAALLSSLEGESELERVWVEEAEERYRAYREGRTKAVSAREAIASARAALKR
jgi:putative addiction module component (TIGR02574 family)